MTKYDLVNGISMSELEWLQVSAMLECFNQVCADINTVDINRCVKLAKSYDYWINIDSSIDVGALIEVVPALDSSISNVVFLDSRGRISALEALRRMALWERFGNQQWSAACKVGATSTGLLAALKIIKTDSRPGIMVTCNVV